ncbi:MAG TPA: cytochrome P450 [Polyangiaceae bacterium]|nr:cytochrome P450 [Polyangiaceae bacterium]
MELRADARIPFPPATVFAACRDEIASLKPYLPSIRSIEVTERAEAGPVVDNVVRWLAGADTPRALRALLPDSILSWTDRATWNADTLECDWRTEMHAFTSAIRCEARDRFLPDAAGTLLEIRGALEVDGRRLPGVPRFLAERVGRAVEALLVGKIQADLVRTGRGLTRYLEDRSGSNGGGSKVPSLPAGPGRLGPVEVLRWVRNPFPVMAELQARYGDAFTVGLPGMPHPIVVVADPDVIRDVFALGPDEGHAGETNTLLKPLLGAHSLFLLDGAAHLRHRRMMLPALHGERMHAYGRTMLELAHDAIDGWPLGRRFSAQRTMQSITLQVILRTVFGVEQGPRFATLADVLARMLDAGGSPLLAFPAMQRDLGPLSPWGRFERLSRRSAEILRAEIRSGREHGTAGRTDVLALLLDARDEAGHPLDEDELHDELVTLLTAGHETTATALAWALRWILADPALATALRDEVASAAGDPRRIAQLALLDGAVKESLRLQPVIALVGRVLKRAMVLGGLSLPAGAMVAPAIYLVHHRASIYPDPERFRPERFSTFKPAPSEWIPFGGGLRKCVGAAFAVYEMKMVLAAILARVDAHLVSPHVGVRRRGVTITPSRGLPIVVSSRRPRDAA